VSQNSPNSLGDEPPELDEPPPEVDVPDPDPDDPDPLLLEPEPLLLDPEVPPLGVLVPPVPPFPAEVPDPLDDDESDPVSEPVSDEPVSDDVSADPLSVVPWSEESPEDGAGPVVTVVWVGRSVTWDAWSPAPAASPSPVGEVSAGVSFGWTSEAISSPPHAARPPALAHRAPTRSIRRSGAMRMAVGLLAGTGIRPWPSAPASSAGRRWGSR
jgi:hypothetical protein